MVEVEFEQSSCGNSLPTVHGPVDVHCVAVIFGQEINDNEVNDCLW